MATFILVYPVKAFWYKRNELCRKKKLVFRVSDQVRHKAACTATEDGKSLEIPDLGIRGFVQTKLLISY